MSIVGTTRDRTAQFKRARQDYHGASTDRGMERLLGTALNSAAAASDVDIEMGAVGVYASSLPSWADEKERIQRSIQQLHDLERQLQIARSQSGLTSFVDETSGQDKVLELTEKIKIKLKATEKEIQGLKRHMDRADDSEQKDKIDLVQRKLAKDLFDFSLKFRKDEYNQFKKQSKATRSTLGTGQASLLDDLEAQLDREEPLFSQQQQELLNHATSEIAERDSQIEQIMSTIGEVAQIMKDLSVLVFQQGEMIDRIDANIFQVRDEVEKGVVQLQKAEQKQKATFAANCILVLAVVVIVLLIIVLLKAVIFGSKATVLG